MVDGRDRRQQFNLGDEGASAGARGIGRFDFRFSSFITLKVLRFTFILAIL